MADDAFEFQIPNRTKMWRDLALTMSQAAALTGVSERQIQHWMDRGYIVPRDPGTRKIDGGNLDMIAVIRQARAAGIPLRRAVDMAREFLNNEQQVVLDGHVSASTVDSLVQQLTTLRTGIGTLEGLLLDSKPRLPVASPDGV